jgi:eukaryotic-like serine/threonine-protein kinase
VTRGEETIRLVGMSTPPSEQEPGPEYAPTRVADRIDAVCDRFEAAWKSGQRPSVGDYLDETAGPEISTLFAELVRLDLFYRGLGGEEPDIDGYASQFPQFSDVLTSLKQEALAQPTMLVPIETEVPPPRIRQYVLRERVGRGGFGTVWKARDTRLNRWVAIKIPREQSDGSEGRDSFLREAQAAAELDHPNIVSVIEAGSEDGLEFLVTKFVDGVSLRGRIRTQSPAPREAAELCIPVARGLEHARTKNVVHRDLKPANILIDGESKPLIADFGLASRRLQDGTIGPGTGLAGTPAYMSPEQVISDRKLDHRTDIYSLGVTLYEMLTGRPPFRGEQHEVLHQIVYSSPPPPGSLRPDIPQDLESICLKAMEWRREDRYQTAGELADDLERFLEGVPVRARPVGRLHRLRRWAARNRALAASISVAVAAVIAAVCLAFIPGLGTPAAASRGTRFVALETEPPGARVVFYGLDERTGEPDPGQRIEAPMRSPVELELLPGDYFVVAALDDGRFHEVYRHVPPLDAGLVDGTKRYYTHPEVPDGIVMQPFGIPDASVTDGMLLVEGSDRFRMGDGREPDLPQHIRRLADLYVDPTEVTSGEWQQLGRGSSSGQQSSASHAARLSYHDALYAAEKLGKRLPTEAEYEYVATNRGRTRYPWGNDDPPAGLLTLERRLAAEPGAVGEPASDRTQTDPPVLGLCSNAPEWTTTWQSLYPPLAEIRPFVASEASERRVVRGPAEGDAADDGGRVLPPWDPRLRRFVHVFPADPKPGLRCVRSAGPHLEASDFGRSGTD